MFQDQLHNLSFDDLLPQTRDFEDVILNKVENKSLDSQSSDSKITYSPINTNHKRKYFSKTDDQLLTKAVIKKKKVSWNEVARYVPGKTPKQCRDRWTNYLQPSLSFDPWTDSDDQLLVSLVNKYGTHWSKMRLYFKNRSTNAIKNRWRFLIKNNVKTLPIEKLILSALTNYSICNDHKKSTINLRYLNSNTDFNSKSENEQQNNNLKFYFLANDAKKDTNSSKNSPKRNFLSHDENNVNLLEVDESDDEIITFTPEELDW